MPEFTLPTVRQKSISSYKLIARLRAHFQVMSYLVGLRCVKTETYHIQPALIFAQTKKDLFFLYMISKQVNVLPHGSVALDSVC